MRTRAYTRLGTLRRALFVLPWFLLIAAVVGGAAREGRALLQGLLICGFCERQMTVHYQGNGGRYPIYECNWLKREGLSSKSCIAFRCAIVDEVISRRILEVLKPDQIEIALKAVEELERRNKTIDNQWRLRIQRAEYETQLAQRRYEEVDPSNRLVAATLEKRWNDELVNLEQVKQQHREFSQKEHLELSLEQRKKLFALAQDLPRIWKSPTTEAKDRKRIIRLLIKDITVEKILEPKKLILHIRWQGGATEDIHCDLPLKIADRLRYSKDLIDRVKELRQKLTDDKIAEALNREGRLSASGKPFNISMVRHIRSAYAIPAPSLKRPEETTVKEVAAKLNISRNIVYYWIQRGYLKARRIKNGMPYWITLIPEDEVKLRQKVLNSGLYQ